MSETEPHVVDQTTPEQRSSVPTPPTEVDKDNPPVPDVHPIIEHDWMPKDMAVVDAPIAAAPDPPDLPQPKAARPTPPPHLQEIEQIPPPRPELPRPDPVREIHTHTATGAPLNDASKRT